MKPCLRWMGEAMGQMDGFGVAAYGWPGFVFAVDGLACIVGDVDGLAGFVVAAHE